MVDIEPEFDVEKDLPEFLSSVLDRTEECIHNSETDINDLQAQSVVLDRTISLLSSIALTDILISVAMSAMMLVNFPARKHKAPVS